MSNIRISIVHFATHVGRIIVDVRQFDVSVVTLILLVAVALLLEVFTDRSLFNDVFVEEGTCITISARARQPERAHL